MKFFSLDEQISNIGLRAVGITDNQTIDGGLIGWLNDGGVLGSGAITNSYVEKIIPDLYLLFYAVASFVVVVGILFYFLYMMGPLSAYSYVVVSEVVKRVILGAVAVSCATWILGWAVEFTDALTAMFGLNAEIMTFVVDMFTSAYSCVFVILGVIGVYQTAMLYVARAEILGCLELIYIIFVIFWVFGAIELSICKSIEGMGALLMRLMLWGLFVTPMMALCYGVGMGIMMSTTEPNAVMMFIGIVVLMFSFLVPVIVFFKFVYNPITPVLKGVYMAGRLL